MHRMSTWRILQHLKHKATSLHPSRAARTSRALLHTHADVTRMQTYTGYGGGGCSENTSPLDRSFRLKAPTGQPITHPVQVHSWSSVKFMQHYYCAFLTKFNACLWAVVPHAAQCCPPSFGTHSQTALQHFTPPQVLDTSSTLCCLLCLFTCHPSCFDSRPRAANRVSTFTRVSKSLWWREICIFVCMFMMSLWGIHKKGWL